jgi:hypothetical protein
MDMAVVTVDGTPLRTGQYFIRWVCGLVDFIFLFGILAVIIISSSKTGQRLGDRVAGTYVAKTFSKQIYPTAASLNYTPAFPQVVRLDPYFIELINRAMEASHDHENEVPLGMVSAQIKSLLEVGNEMPAKKFLAIVLHDFKRLNAR